jgi:uncharacterized protein YjiS (DUF1127 family)
VRRSIASDDPFFRCQNRTKEIVMKMFSLTRFLRRRRTYKNVLQELSRYSDYELQDIGLVRVDVREIARRTSREQH